MQRLWFMYVLTLVLCIPSWSQQNNREGNSDVSFPPFWVMLKDDPDDLLRAMDQTPEPYTEPMLDALQKALPKFPNKSPAPGLAPDNTSALLAAEILYRYHRQAGHDYLAQQLAHDADGEKMSSTLAAILFAYGQEKSMRGPVLRTLAAHTYSPDLTEALGRWHDPTVADALWQAFQQDPGNSILARAVAQQGVHQAAPLIRHIYFSSLPDKQEKINAAAALVSLDGDKASVMLRYLLETLALGPQNLAPSDRYELRQYAAIVVGEMDIKQAIPTLRSLVRRYMGEKHPHGSETDTDAAKEESLIEYAVQSLAQMHDASSKELILELLGYLKKNDSGVSDGLAKAALDLGIANATIRKYLNSDDDMAHIQSLRYQEKTSRPTDR